MRSCELRPKKQQTVAEMARSRASPLDPEKP